MINLQSIKIKWSFWQNRLCYNFIKIGLSDCAIRIWDTETYLCIRILGKPNLNLSTRSLPETHLLELIEKSDAITHFSDILFLNINDKYLVPGSLDGSFIISKSSDFKPIHRLILPQTYIFDLISVVLYGDCIICYNVEYTRVQKSSLDNLEHQLKFNLQLR